MFVCGEGRGERREGGERAQGRERRKGGEGEGGGRVGREGSERQFFYSNETSLSQNKTLDFVCYKMCTMYKYVSTEYVVVTLASM